MTARNWPGAALGLAVWLVGWSAYCVVALTGGPSWWPSCGPTFRVMEQVYGGRLVYWLRKTDGTWPLCSSVLQRGAYDTLDEALREARSRSLRPVDTDERQVGEVP